MFWHRKKRQMLKVLKTGLNLDLIGNAVANWFEVLEQATKSLASCYRQRLFLSLRPEQVCGLQKHESQEQQLLPSYILFHLL